MSNLESLLNVFAPLLGTLAGVAMLLFLVNWLAKRGNSGNTSLGYQVLKLFISVIAALAIVITLPLTNETQGQVLSLLGVVITAVIAISATTFVANAMAGVMLQVTQPFRPGDYLRIGEQFGRVTKRSLVHTQIQTEWRDITTLPNLLLVNNPITVLHREGTIISAEISLGYDIPYTRIEDLLLRAAEDAGLEESYVMVQELLDHAVVYLIAGFLPETKNLLSARSLLRKKVLEQLHGHGVEIVSPSFMNQRQLAPEKKVIPDQPVLHMRRASDIKPVEAAPEARIFDKAEEAANLEEIKQQQEDLKQKIKELKSSLKDTPEEARPAQERKLELLEQQSVRLAEKLKKQDEDSSD
jgi:small conductance mechanosensitive channel